MAIPFHCPYCGHQTEVDEKYAGQSGPCVSCGNTISVPAAYQPPRQVSPSASKKKKSLWGVLTLIGISVLGVFMGTGLVVAILLPAIEAARHSAKRSACTSNLQRIASGLQMYHEDYGSYPPSVVLDGSGKPMHSWRVLLLPYLGIEAERIHRQYNFAEPWDGPVNSRLFGQMPSVYACPSDRAVIQGETSYLAVTGAETALDTQPKSREDIKDDYAATLLVMEASGGGVNWLDPKDIPIGKLRAGLNSGNATSPGSDHSRGVNAVMADGQVRSIDDGTSASELRAMATISGGEFVDVVDFEN